MNCAHILIFVVLLPGRKPSGDNADDIQWIVDTATERARRFGISGVDYRLALGVVKNIVPAIASTNAIIAGLTGRLSSLSFSSLPPLPLLC